MHLSNVITNFCGSRHGAEYMYCCNLASFIFFFVHLRDYFPIACMFVSYWYLTAAQKIPDFADHILQRALPSFDLPQYIFVPYLSICTSVPCVRITHSSFSGRQSLYNMLGEAYFKLDSLAEAEHWYREALRVKPDHVPAHLTYGKLLAKMVRTRESRHVLLVRGPCWPACLPPRVTRPRLPAGRLHGGRGEQVAAVAVAALGALRLPLTG